MGASTTEIELKLLLPSRDAHARVRALLDPDRRARVVLQENAFLDTRALDLRAAGFSLRLRTTRARPPDVADVTHALTLKGKGRAANETENPLSVRPELERAVDGDAFDALATGERDPFAFFDDDAPDARALVDGARRARAGRSLAVVGRFANERTHLPVTLALPSGHGALVVELDETDFGDGARVYEVELEVRETRDADPALRWLEGLLASIDVVGVPAPGKASRFFARLALPGAGAPVGAPHGDDEAR